MKSIGQIWRPHAKALRNCAGKSNSKEFKDLARRVELDGTLKLPPFTATNFIEGRFLVLKPVGQQAVVFDLYDFSQIVHWARPRDIPYSALFNSTHLVWNSGSQNRPATGVTGGNIVAVTVQDLWDQYAAAKSP